MTLDLDFVAPLFVPANRPERLSKVAASGADAVIVDLEDAVASDDKIRARASLVPGTAEIPLFVRVNAIGTPWHGDDVSAVLALPGTGIMLPKAEAGEDLSRLCEEVSTRGRHLVALVETARGISSARAMADIPGLGRFAFGSIDLCADLGCEHTRFALAPARWELVLASRLGGLPAPVDGVTTAIDHALAVEDDARYARELGFGGKLCIHPRQILPALAGFRPTAEEYVWAEAVLASGDGAARVDGMMVDEPVRARARRILSRPRA